MNYIACHFEVAPTEPWTDILVEELGSLGFESFLYSETGVIAYIQAIDWSKTLLERITLKQNDNITISHDFELIEEENWNATWESSFEPICVMNRCTIRAPFHPQSSTELDVVINPKMSFGTGHHQTTYMMVQLLLNIDTVNMCVLDMGCGTGLLAIIAHKLGAKHVTAIDIDEWSFNNSKENILVNDCLDINVINGDASVLGNETYDLILANINRNVLLNDIKIYTSVLERGGMLLLSGFYKSDIPMIDQCAKEAGLRFVEHIERDDWIAMKYLY